MEVAQMEIRVTKNLREEEEALVTNIQEAAPRSPQREDH